jgi:predicted nucleic acid-binding protein
MDVTVTVRRPRLFIDTGALIAVYDERDALHSRAVRFRDEILLPYQVEMFCSYYVVAEALNNLQRRLWAGKMRNMDFDRAADELALARFLRILPINGAVNVRAREIISKYERRFSFTDATSLAILEREGIRNIFSFDRDFERYPMKVGHTTIFLSCHPSSVPLSG